MPTTKTNPKHLSDTQKQCPACEKMFYPNKYQPDQKCCTTDCAKTMPRGEYRKSVIRTCTMCPNEFKCPARSTRTTCSPSCSAKQQWQTPDKIPVLPVEMVSINCVSCKNDFDHPLKHTEKQLAIPYPKTCSPECKRAFTYEKRKCADCPNEFYILASQKENVSGRWCSRACATTPKAYRWRAKQMRKTRQKHGLKAYGCHQHEYAGHKLDSGWELVMARRLDEIGILWTRGYHRIPWQDSFGEWFEYEPDFYLPDYDAFIEVKGEHLMRIDETQSDKQAFITGHCKDVVFVRSEKECKQFSVNILKTALDTQRSRVI
ncbi:MAG: hypothetical protein K8953_11275 [Proteobacteria bacterium]|nr:hypothetical protein [Pseudomonadota bacterium]